MRIVSACLLGIKCRFDNKIKSSKKIIGLSKREILIPVCPEQLGGLSTPREPAEKKGDRVFTKSGKEVTKEFNAGAREVLKIAKIFHIKEAILKQRSSSCGYGKIFNGKFSNRLKRGKGVAASLLEKNGIKIIIVE